MNVKRFRIHSRIVHTLLPCKDLSLTICSRVLPEPGATISPQDQGQKEKGINAPSWDDAILR
jgi:hypothetical protein